MPGTWRSARSSTHTHQGKGPGSSPPAPLLLGGPSTGSPPTHSWSMSSAAPRGPGSASFASRTDPKAAGRLTSHFAAEETTAKEAQVWSITLDSRVTMGRLYPDPGQGHGVVPGSPGTQLSVQAQEGLATASRLRAGGGQWLRQGVGRVWAGLGGERLLEIQPSCSGWEQGLGRGWYWDPPSRGTCQPQTGWGRWGSLCLCHLECPSLVLIALGEQHNAPASCSRVVP